MSERLRYKYFDVVPLNRTRMRKHRGYQVVNKQDILLGYIEWQPSWRQYVLQTEEWIEWSAGCLQDVCDAIAKINAARTRP